MKCQIKFLEGIEDFDGLKKGTRFVVEDVGSGREFDMVFRTRYPGGKIIFIHPKSSEELLDYSFDPKTCQHEFREGKLRLNLPVIEDAKRYAVSPGILAMRVSSQTGIEPSGYYQSCRRLIT